MSKPIDEEMVDLFQSKLEGFTESWPLNYARKRLYIVALRRHANKLEEELPEEYRNETTEEEN